MIALGIDPGIASCGLALVEDAPWSGGRRVIRVLWGATVTTAAGEPTADRVRVVSQAIRVAISVKCPELVAVEGFAFYGQRESVRGLEVSRVVGAAEALAEAAAVRCEVLRRIDVLRAFGLRGEVTKDRAALALGAVVTGADGLSTEHERDAAAAAVAGLWRVRARRFR